METSLRQPGEYQHSSAETAATETVRAEGHQDPLLSPEQPETRTEAGCGLWQQQRGEY